LLLGLIAERLIHSAELSCLFLVEDLLLLDLFPLLLLSLDELEDHLMKCRNLVSRRGKGYQYLVRWTGYDDPTLEPARTIYEDVPQLVRDFHRRYRDRPVPPFVR
jgi:hypothetical protein